MNFNFNGTDFNVNNVLNRMDHKSLVIKEYEKIKNHLVFEDSNMTIYSQTNPSIELSKGCQACKNGSWWCLFVGNNCNKACNFCPQNKSIEELNKWDHPKSITNYWIDDVKLYLDKFGDKLTGVSYSGGEPLMYLDKILEISEYIKKTKGHIYQWVYTNGILLNEERLYKLKENCIEEIRVDLAATDFNDRIIDRLQLVKNIIGKVTVEVPSVPEVYKKLIEEKYIHKLIEIGVEQLNLAELSLCQKINWETYAKDQDIYIYDSPNSITHSPVYSRMITINVIKYAIDNNLNILINDCSNDAKHIQGIMRQQYTPFATR